MKWSVDNHHLQAVAMTLSGVVLFHFLGDRRKVIGGVHLVEKSPPCLLLHESVQVAQGGRLEP